MAWLIVFSIFVVAMLGIVVVYWGLVRRRWIAVVAGVLIVLLMLGADRWFRDPCYGDQDRQVLGDRSVC